MLCGRLMAWGVILKNCWLMGSLLNHSPYASPIEVLKKKSGGKTRVWIIILFIVYVDWSIGFLQREPRLHLIRFTEGFSVAKDDGNWDKRFSVTSRFGTSGWCIGPSQSPSVGLKQTVWCVAGARNEIDIPSIENICGFIRRHMNCFSPVCYCVSRLSSMSPWYLFLC